MIIECKQANIIEVIKHCKSGSLSYLNIIKKKDLGLIMSYKLVFDLEGEEERKHASSLINNNLPLVTKLIKNLEELKDALDNNIEIIDFNLLFDATKYGNKIEYSHSFSYSKDSKAKTDKKNIWKELSEQNIVDNSNVPGIYRKISSKKYVPVTYSELVQTMKEYVDEKINK